MNTGIDILIHWGTAGAGDIGDNGTGTGACYDSTADSDGHSRTTGTDTLTHWRTVGAGDLGANRTGTSGCYGTTADTL